MKKAKNAMGSIVVISLCCVLFGNCAKGPVDGTAEIKKANELFASAVSTRDTSALRGLYTEDAKLFPANSEMIEGSKAIAGFWNAVIGMGIQKVSFETTQAQIIGDVAIEEGNYKLFVGGDQVADQGKYMVTWKNDGGKWKVQRDIWNGNTPAPQQRAMANDTVLLVLNYVKADKVTQFEDFNINYLVPAGAEFNAKAKKTIRMQKPVGQNKDGTYTYIYFMDPYLGVNDYNMLNNLSAKYGEQKAAEYMKMYLDCLKDGKSHSIVGVETAW